MLDKDIVKMAKRKEQNNMGNSTEKNNIDNAVKQEPVKVKKIRKSQVRTGYNKKKDLRWEKLDNTANLFPVIASQNVSNVYRVSVTLNEEIDEVLLQKSVEKVLPYFDVFNYRLKKGMFWYYFETNKRPVPKVQKEDTYPCMYINPQTNKEYLFRVTYFERRINLEVFHVLTDGNGAFAFLKEITYQYLRYKHAEFKDMNVNGLQADTSLDKEDSYVKNYKKKAKKNYKTEKAVIVTGEKLPVNNMGIIHGYLDLAGVKTMAKKYNVTINQLLVGTYVWSVYKECLNSMQDKRPISVCVPVNLRPYFNSCTLRNFFAVVTATFKAEKEDYTYEEVIGIIAESLNKQINKENLENLLSYNVSNEKNKLIRGVPLVLKNFIMKIVYNRSARANTGTITNLGVLSIADEYKAYIDKFHAMISMSKGQNLKAAICSYQDKLVFTFTSSVRDTAVQKTFFRKFTEEGVNVSIESNGVYYE